MGKTPRRLIRFTVVLVIAAGAVFGVRQFRHTQAAAALPMATAHKGDFLVLVRTRGQLIAQRSEQLPQRRCARESRSGGWAWPARAQ